MKSGSWSSFQAALPPEARAGGEPEDDEVPGTVEDSHARLAAEMRDTATFGIVLDWAARVEQLGQISEQRRQALLLYEASDHLVHKAVEEREAREAEIAKVREEMLCHAAGVDPEKCSAFQEHTRRICLEWAARLGGAS